MAKSATATGEERWFERTGLWAPSLLLCVSSLVMVYAFLGTPVLEGNRGLTNLTESYGALERVALWQQALQWLPGATGDGEFFELRPWMIAWFVRLAFVGMFLAQAWGFWLAWRGPARSVWPWLVAPAIAHVIMILMVPSNADVFFYQMTGDLAASGYNPYLHPLLSFPEHPILPLNHWIEMTAVYGPAWTGINAAIMSLTGPDPVPATYAYKIILGIVALGLTVLIYFFARRITGSNRLAIAATVLVGWQPNMLVESTGQAHNDPVMLLLSTAGLFLVIAGGVDAIRGGMVLITLSALVKYVTLPLLGLLGLIRIVDRRQPSSWRRILTAWLLDGIAIVAVIGAVFAPFWAGLGTLREMFLEPGRLYTNPVWFGSWMLLDYLIPGRVATLFRDLTRAGMQLATLGIIAWAIYRFIRAVVAPLPQNDLQTGLPSWTGPLLVAWTIILTALALLPVNSHPWYWTWPVVPIALLTAWNARIHQDASPPPLPRWFWGYLGLTAIMTLAYHTRIVHL